MFQTKKAHDHLLEQRQCEQEETHNSNGSAIKAHRRIHHGNGSDGGVTRNHITVTHEKSGRLRKTEIAVVGKRTVLEWHLLKGNLKMEEVCGREANPIVRGVLVKSQLSLTRRNPVREGPKVGNKRNEKGAIRAGTPVREKECGVHQIRI